MKALFGMITLGAAAWLAYAVYLELNPQPDLPAPTPATLATPSARPARTFTVAEVQPATPEPIVAPPAATPAPAPTPVAVPVTPAPPRFAPSGVFYLTQRVSIMTSNGVLAAEPGEAVKILGRNKDGTARVIAGKHEFVVKQAQLTNNLDLADEARRLGGLPLVTTATPDLRATPKRLAASKRP